MKVVVTYQAARDLEQIGEYIAQDSRKRARSFIRELRNAAMEIGRAPEAFQFAEGYEHRGFRRRIHGAYLIFYRVEEEQVLVIRVLHGARYYPAIVG